MPKMFAKKKKKEQGKYESLHIVRAPGPGRYMRV